MKKSTPLKVNTPSRIYSKKKNEPFDKLIKAFKKVFKEPKRKVDHEIQL